VWRCSGCSHRVAAVPLPREPARGGHPYEGHAERMRWESMSAVERDRVRTQELLAEARAALRRYQADPRFEDLSGLERVAEELLARRSSLPEPKRALEFHRAVQREARKLPSWLRPRRDGS